MEAIRELKKDIGENTLKSLYVFYGEEDYLISHYINEIRTKLIDVDFESFNLNIFSQLNFNFDEFYDAISSLPMMSEKKLIILNDIDIFKLSDKKDEFFTALDEISEDCCVIINYTNIEFKPDKRTKNYTSLKKMATFIEFKHYSNDVLASWIKRRFKALKKEIEPETCQYLILNCGVSMTSLANEIDKLSNYSDLDTITTRQIDIVCTKILSAVVFDIASFILNDNLDKAVSTTRELINKKSEPIAILAAITKHYQRLYIAKLAYNAGKNDKYLMDKFGIRYPSFIKNISMTARKLNIQYLRNAMQYCLECDVKMKSTGEDKESMLIMLILNLREMVKYD